MKSEKPVNQSKIEAVAKLTAALENAKSVCFVDYTGMNMKSQQGLMNTLKENNGQMVVAKNTLIKIAAKNAGLPEEVLTDTVLSGQTAMVVSSVDPISPLQAIAKFIKLEEKPKWKAGVVEGTFQDAINLDKLSKLPGKDQLIAQAIGSISSPLYGLIGTLNGNILKLVYVLQAKAAQG